MNKYPNGVWPVMLTPFTEDNKIDYPALERLVDFYIKAGVTGLFAVCQSSELFFLDMEERAELSRKTIEFAKGRVAVVSGGQTATDLETQIKEVENIAATGTNAVVLLTNQFAEENEDDDIWWQNLESLLESISPDIKLGLYECPYPHKRVVSPELLRKCAATGRFAFMKDTCCDEELIEKKLEAIKEFDFKLYNANTATLLESLRSGANGYSGVMANFHPDLYVWLCNNYNKDEAELLEDFLTMSSFIELRYYPVNAKYGLHQKGIMDIYSRTKDPTGLSETNKREVRQLIQISEELSEKLRVLKGS